MTVPRLAASALAVAAVLLTAASLLHKREGSYTSVLVDAKRSFENADRYAAAHGIHADAETHKLAVHTGTDYGDDKVFGADQVFGENDRFGDHNHFGKGTRFAAATRFGDDNTFGSGSVIPSAARFGPGNEFGDEVTIGPMATLGAGAKLGEGSVVGENAAFGPGVTIGKDSVLAGGVIFSGGDHFGEGIHFGPNTRFGPNTVFDGAEIFSQGCTFGDATRFNAAKAGKDTFEGQHYFGEHIEWGDNEPLPPHPDAVEHGGSLPPPASPSAASPPAAHPDSQLPPGYTKTAIPGVYQYTAPAAEEEAAGPQHVQWQWNHPTAVPLAGAGLSLGGGASAEGRRGGMLAGRSAPSAAAASSSRAREGVVARLRATAGQETHASRQGRLEAEAEAAANAKLSAWLRAHPLTAGAGAAGEVAAAGGGRVRV